MKRILVTGMSGVGKSTVIAALADRGYTAVDLDQPPWSEYGRAHEAELARMGLAVTEQQEWLWREDLVTELLADDDGEVLFVAGCSANQGGFYPRFDRVVLLTASEELTRERLATRTGNPFGKRPEELVKVLADKAEVEPLLRRGADLEIDTAAPLDEVVDLIVALVDG